MKIFLIEPIKFESLIAANLSEEQVKKINDILHTMSLDEYDGYSPEEQNKYKQIVNICGDNLLPPEEVSRLF